MTPREKNWAAWVSAAVAVLFLIGSMFAFGASMVATDKVVEEKLADHNRRLEKVEKNQDEMLALLRELAARKR